MLTLAVSCSASNDTASPSSSSSSSSPDATAPPSPDGDLYRPPDPLPAGAPGALIWAEKVEIPELNPPATVWRMLYHSRSEQGRDIAVSGFAVVPSAAPTGERPVFAWAHGTVGLGDECAPSHEIRDNLPPFGGQQIERGAVLVAADYEGMGTPGVPTFSGVAEGQAVLDGVRAASTLPNVGSIGAVVVAGHSQGGPAALFAAEIAPEYAPDLDLVGVVALAPGAELAALADSLAESPYKGLVLIGAAGLRAAHPDLDLSAGLTDTAVEDLPRVESECVDATVERYQTIPVTRCRDSARRAKIRHSSSCSTRTLPDQRRSRYRSSSDMASTINKSRWSCRSVCATKYCAMGGNVTRKTYEGEDHDGVVDASETDVLAFLTARYQNEPLDSSACN